MQVPDALFQRPQIRLAGPVNENMLNSFLDQFGRTSDNAGPVVLELTTSGGDADIGRRIAEDVRIESERGRQMLFLGKTAVFSAGVTIMSGFPIERRFLTRDAMLLIHERRLSKELKLDGALRSVEGVIRDVLSEVRSGQALERAGFEALVEGSALQIDELCAHVMKKNWYLAAAKAFELKLVAAVI